MIEFKMDFQRIRNTAEEQRLKLFFKTKCLYWSKANWSVFNRIKYFRSVLQGHSINGPSSFSTNILLMTFIH